MSSKLLERVEVVVFWILSFAFFLAAIGNFVYGQLIFGCLRLIVALGLFPPLKFPFGIKMIALAIAGLLLFL